MFPGYSIRAVTNGVHVRDLDAPGLWPPLRGAAPGWGHDPEVLARGRPAARRRGVGGARRRPRGDLLAEVARRPVSRCDPTLPLIGFARRMTGYKRPDLLFADVERLRAITARRRSSW